jgi:hypothetical protein
MRSISEFLTAAVIQPPGAMQMADGVDIIACRRTDVWATQFRMQRS